MIESDAWSAESILDHDQLRRETTDDQLDEQAPSDEHAAYRKLICEISAYRKGYIEVVFDWQRELIVWQDSNRWYNNFVRALSSADITRSIEISCLIFSDKPTGDDVPDKLFRHGWKITLMCEDAVYQIRGQDMNDPRWLQVSELVGDIARRSLRL